MASGGVGFSSALAFPRVRKRGMYLVVKSCEF